MKKTLLIMLAFSGLFRVASAQNFPYGNVSQEELDMKKYSQDTSAHAVVLQEYGTSRINVASDDDIKLIFEYHVKVKIFDNRGFDEGTVAVKIRNNKDNTTSDQLDNITGVTYYKDEHGTVQQVELDPKKVYNTRDYKYQSTSKFTMPGMRDGCVIEYKYRLESPFFLEHFRPWNFQSDIPKIYSEYEAHIPGHFTYNAALRGFLKLTKSKADIEPGCFSTHGASSDCSDIKYGMSDIPAFIEEDHMTSPKNYISAIEFELVEYTDPYKGTKVKATKEWRDIDYALKTEQEFGSQLKRKELLKERIAPVIAGKNDDLEKAKAIYQYLQKWFKWNDYIGYESNDGIKKALDSHSGSIADINISLIDALNSAGINAQAVLLSTRDNGAINDVYPGVTDFNYVIAKADIGDKTYLLDATDPLLAFGMLPLKCLNDKGRVFSLDKPSYWMSLDQHQKEKSTSTLDVTLGEDGKLTGTLTSYYIGYEGYERRSAIKKYNTIDEYVEKLNAESPKIKIVKAEILKLDSLDQPLVEKFDVEIDVMNKLTKQFTFDPFFWNKVTVNPFKLAERSYPVDWGMASDDRFTIIMHLPAQYSIATPPQPVAIALPDDGGKFLTSYEPDANTFTFSNIIQFNKAIYSSEEYPYLKELYNKIILSEKSEMVFKKKS